MKKFMRTIALALVMAMMMGITAFAAPVVEAEAGKNVSATVNDGGKKLDSVTYQDGKIAKDGQYMIFVVNKEDGSYLPTASSILYINQKQAEGNGTITFENVFPKAMRSSGIMISGTGLSMPELIAKIIAALLGYVNEDDDITAADAQEVLRFSVGLSSLITDTTFEWLGRSDVNGDDDITAADAQEILRYSVGLSSMLDDVYGE